ncbi:hypothetical protein ACIQC5_20325 [Paenarthrobacter sp. NPDC092416]|uniref:hypothetical protein n=1 Tax=Paenarthrobacter sp. NPDC092416 TaxID=3364386 RepID=UPI0037F41902
MTTTSNPLAANRQPGARGHVWCGPCRSSAHLAIESIESLEPHSGELRVGVDYVCTRCQTFYTHTAAFHEVAAVLNRTGTLAGVVQFGGKYIHCGELMSFSRMALRSVHVRIPSSDARGELPAVHLRIKVLKCQCGFRMELPA